MINKRKNFSAKGFLLFEVMVSIAAITAGILFIIRPFNTARVAVERSRELLIASLLLDNKMRELEHAGAIHEGTWQGDFFGDEHYGWSIDSVKVPGEDFNTVTVKVRYKHAPDQTLCSALTYLINGKDDEEKTA